MFGPTSQPLESTLYAQISLNNATCANDNNLLSKYTNAFIHGKIYILIVSNKFIFRTSKSTRRNGGRTSVNFSVFYKINTKLMNNFTHFLIRTQIPYSIENNLVLVVNVDLLNIE